jgi:hypothetical protein
MMRNGDGFTPLPAIGQVTAASDLRNWIKRLPAGKHQALIPEEALRLHEEGALR